MSREDKIKAKIRKLLAQAEDTAGTPESDVFMGKALALLAKYGFEQRDLGGDNDTAGSEFISHRFEFTGAYTDMQSYLLGCITTALHCKGYRNQRPRSTKCDSMVIFGMRRHVERIQLLFPLLNNAMASQLKKVQHSTNPFGSTSIVTERRSFMFGFSQRIMERLNEAENNADDNTTDTGYALVLVKDRDATEQAWKNFTNNLSLRKSKIRNNVTAQGFNHGQDVANNTDIGQTRVGSIRGALTS